MRNDLSDPIALVRHKAQELNQELKDTKIAANSIMDASREAEQQAISVAAASNEMVATTQEIAANCERAAVLADQSSNVTQESVKLIRTTIKDIRDQSSYTTNDAAKVQALADQTQKIGSIVGTIDEIASQTNLLLVLVRQAVALPWLLMKFVLWHLVHPHLLKRFLQWLARFRKMLLRQLAL